MPLGKNFNFRTFGPPRSLSATPPHVLIPEVSHKILFLVPRQAQNSPLMLLLPFLFNERFFAVRRTQLHFLVSFRWFSSLLKVPADQLSPCASDGRITALRRASSVWSSANYDLTEKKSDPCWIIGTIGNYQDLSLHLHSSSSLAGPPAKSAVIGTSRIIRKSGSAGVFNGHPKSG